MPQTKVTDIHGVLRKSIREPFEILNQETRPLTTPGDHYGSIMLAVDLKVKFPKDGSEKVLHLAAKLPPANEMLKKAFDVQWTFRKEAFAYTDMLPAIAAFQEQFQVPEEGRIAGIFPKCYGVRLSLDDNSNQVENEAVILFENLKLQGYYTGDRLVGLDFRAVEVILKDLAKFHATTLALKKLKPGLFEEKLRACARISNTYALPAEFEAALKDGVIDGAKEVADLQPYLERIQQVIADFRGINRPVTDDTWATICHADFWLSNTMLLKSAGGFPVSSKILDLQLAVYAPALTDLVFFLFTSITNSVLEESFDEFLRIYYDSFTATLGRHGIDMGAYSWESFERELEVAGPIEVCHILMMLKPICTEKNGIKNSFEEFQDSDWNRKDLLGPIHRRKLRDTVLALIRRKWL